MIITRQINKWHDMNQFRIILVYGHSGLGKSAYSWKCLQELYPHQKDIKVLKKDPVLDEGRLLWEEDKGSPYSDIRKYLIFKPEELLNFSEYMTKYKKRYKAILIDDAGLWFASERWRDPFVEAAIKWLQVARSIVSTVIFTTTNPNNIVRRLRTSDMYTVRIRPYRKGWRHAKGYSQSVMVNNKTYFKTIWEDAFYYYIEDNLYSWYKDVRASYVKEVNKMMKAGLEEEKRRKHGQGHD